MLGWIWPPVCQNMSVSSGSRRVGLKLTSARSGLFQDLMVADELGLVLEDIQSLTGKKISFDIFMDIDADEPRSSTAEVM